MKISQLHPLATPDDNDLLPILDINGGFNGIPKTKRITVADLLAKVTTGTGAQGIQGIQGEKGDTGETGAQGIQGIQGEKGDTGETGAQGIQGIQGEKGDTGAAGATGAQGLQGERGIKGDPGVDGAPGTDRGSKWYTGSTVPSGTLGVVGDFYLRSSNGVYYEKTASSIWTNRGNLTGATGAQGIQGVAGANGTNGTNGSGGTWTRTKASPFSLPYSNGTTYLTYETFTIPANTLVADSMFRAQILIGATNATVRVLMNGIELAQFTSTATTRLAEFFLWIDSNGNKYSSAGTVTTGMTITSDITVDIQGKYNTQGTTYLIYHICQVLKTT